MTVQDAPDGTCPECGETLMISHAVRMDGPVIISKHCDKEWRTPMTESNAKLVIELAESFKMLKNLVEPKEATIK